MLVDTEHIQFTYGKARAETNLRILLVDIETSPNITYTFDLWQANIGPEKFIKPSEMICWAAKWLDEKKVFFRSVFHHDKQKMLEDLYKLMCEADIIIHYNGKKFDIPNINKEFLLAGIRPPSSYKQIDLYLIGRTTFKFASNRLGYVTEVLGIGTKVAHEGFELWKGCLEGNAESWKTMRKYNMTDVEIMEPLFFKFLPWIRILPPLAALTGLTQCPCGSTNLKPDGITYTNTSTFPRFRCDDCGKSMRGTKRMYGTGITTIAP